MANWALTPPFLAPSPLSAQAVADLLAAHGLNQWGEEDEGDGQGGREGEVLSGAGMPPGAAVTQRGGHGPGKKKRAMPAAWSLACAALYAPQDSPVAGRTRAQTLLRQLAGGTAAHATRHYTGPGLLRHLHTQPQHVVGSCGPEIIIYCTCGL